MPDTYYAHSLPGHGPSDWEPLARHLREVANLSGRLAEEAGLAELVPRARLAGMLHDLGKYHDGFQEYLRRAAQGRPATRVAHAAVGASQAYASQSPDVALAIMGHHAGIPDAVDMRTSLQQQVDSHVLERAQADLGEALRQVPGPLPSEVTHDPLAIDLLVRMLFSCLVDADWLATEAFMQRDGLDVHVSPPLDADVLLGRLDHYVASLPTEGPVNAWRARVRESCRQAARQPPGCYSLTVPTGGGKTLSSIAFALEHARWHRLRRVIYVIPYLSIIEQNAQVLRRALGEDAVVEHHSLACLGEHDPGEQPDPGRRAAENWDYPIIVTTTVQFFESLFASRPGACRKLHNIPRSVVVFDECQTLPPGLLTPILEMLSRLVDHYGMTAVFCTATQPALGRSGRMPSGLSSIREIVPYREDLFRALHRTRVTWPTEGQRLSWGDVATAMARAPQQQALCVVNTVSQASELFQLLRDQQPGAACHLSSRMCPAHRLDVLAMVRQRLASGEPCLVASTQVVEAGVDLDFPTVLRAMGPLDSIAQAAGRCNREGQQPGLGEVVVFVPEDDSSPPGWYELGRKATWSALQRGLVDINDPESFRAYFEDLYGSGELDAHSIQDRRRRLAFATVAERFHIIDSPQQAVVVQYCPNDSSEPGPGPLIDEAVSRRCLTRRAARRLQRYMVNLPLHEFECFLREGVIDELVPGFFVWAGPYDSACGIHEGQRGPLIL